MTQKELAERTGINQADISKLENGTRNLSVNLLKRLADGMGMRRKSIKIGSIVVEFDKVRKKNMGYEFCMEKKMREFV